MKEITLNFLNSACLNMYSCGILAIALTTTTHSNCDRLEITTHRNSDRPNSRLTVIAIATVSPHLSLKIFVLRVSTKFELTADCL
jgi:hypothetical protein